jgi:hypothetical protein
VVENDKKIWREHIQGIKKKKEIIFFISKENRVNKRFLF